MEVTVETSGPATAKISFRVPADEFRKEYQGGLRQVAQRVRMKGFRPGKVPFQVLEKRFGEQVRRDVMEHFLREAYQRALDEEDLKPMSHPRVPPGALATAEDGSFALDFEVGLKPEVELPSYRGMAIESELEPVLDEHVDHLIEDLRRQESVPEPAGEDGIDEHGIVLCDVSFLHEDEQVLRREGLRLSTRTPPPGVDPDAFRDALMGATDGSVIELDALLPPTLEKEEARGQQGRCRVEVREAFRMVPPADEELFAKLDVEDDAAMRAKVRERIEAAAAERERTRVESALLERLIKETPMELPEALVEEQTEARLRQLADQMLAQDVDPERVEEQLTEQRPTAREEAERGLKALLVVEALGEKESLLVTEEDLETELGAIAERNDVPLDEVRRYYAENRLGQQMAIEVLERKVRRFLRENAEVTQPR